MIQETHDIMDYRVSNRLRFNKKLRKLVLEDYRCFPDEDSFLDDNQKQIYYTWELPRVDRLYMFSKFSHEHDLHNSKLYYIDDPTTSKTHKKLFYKLHGLDI